MSHITLLALLPYSVFFSPTQPVSLPLLCFPFSFLLLNFSPVFIPFPVSLISLRYPPDFYFLLLFSVEGFAFLVVTACAKSTSHFTQFCLFCEGKSMCV